MPQDRNDEHIGVADASFLLGVARYAPIAGEPPRARFTSCIGARFDQKSIVAGSSPSSFPNSERGSVNRGAVSSKETVIS